MLYGKTLYDDYMKLCFVGCEEQFIFRSEFFFRKVVARYFFNFVRVSLLEPCMYFLRRN